MGQRFVGGVSRYVEEDDPRRCGCGGDLPTQAWPRCKPCDRDRKRAERLDQPEGVYLAVLKLIDGGWLLKVGHTSQARSKAGRLATDAYHNHGIMAEWGEVLWLVETDGEEDRKELEAAVLASVEPDLADEYFDARRYDEFRALTWMAKPFERSTTEARRQEFLTWLSLRE